MYITNNRATFNLVKHQKVSKYYEKNCRYSFFQKHIPHCLLYNSGKNGSSVKKAPPAKVESFQVSLFYLNQLFQIAFTEIC